MHVRFGLPDGSHDEAQMPAVPRIGEMVVMPNQRPLYVVSVIWAPYDADADFDVYVILERSRRGRR